MRGARLLWLLVLTVACEPRGSAGEGAAPPAEPAASGALPERFGFGRPATPEEIARLDIDVRPDGRGLPAGHGTPAQGAAIYASRCAVCHGPEGEGTPLAGALVGRTPGDVFDFGEASGRDRTRTVGNYWPYATTLFDYVRRAMPFDQPGSLSDEEVYAVSAYLLHRNDLLPEDAVLDSASLPRVRMPARDRFVPDDREGTSRVR